MRIERYEITMEHEFHEHRAGSKYLIGDAFKNHGEFAESVCKHRRGLDYFVNPTTDFMTGSDIESEHMSIKSDKSSLARCYGATKDEVLEKFFTHCASQFFCWAWDKDGYMTEFIMDKTEFYEFCVEFGRLGVESSAKANAEGYKVRFGTTTKKMVAWFEARAVA